MKKAKSCVAAALLLVLLAGCGSRTTAPSATAEAVEREAISQGEICLEPTEELIIWSAGGIFPDTLDRFRELYPGVTVRERKLLLSDYLAALEPEALERERPDVLLFSPYTSPYKAVEDPSYPDLQKLMDAGALLDLTPILEQDEAFRLEKYSASALDAGAYRGGRYLLPLSVFHGYSLLAKEETLAELGYRGEDVSDAASFLRELARIRAGLGERAMISVLRDSCSDLEQLYRMAQPELVDYEAGIALPEEERFQDYCEAVKEFLFGGEESPLNRYSTYRESVEVLQEDRAVFSQVSDGDVLAFSALKAKAQPQVVTAPGWDGGTPAGVYTVGGICAGSRNQKNAWNFLKLLLEEGRFVGDGLDPEGVGESLEGSMDRAPGRVEKVLEGLGWSGASLSRTDREQLRALHLNYDTCRLYSPEVYRLYEKHMTPYFQGREEYGPCAAGLREALEEYLRS